MRRTAKIHTHIPLGPRNQYPRFVILVLAENRFGAGSLTEPLLSGAENFTIYIKNFIRFPKFEFSK